MKKTNLIFIVLGLSLLPMMAFASNGFKFGKISKEEIALSQCDFEPGAEAIVLFDKCNVSVSYSTGVSYTRHVRIKLLKENALDRADIALSFYRKDGMENIHGIKAHTININEKGKPEFFSVDSESIFSVDVSENYGEKRFSFPQVKVGSIIEYKYTLHSKFYTFLDTWYFQTDIPTLHSILSATIQEGFDYRIVTLGNRLQRKYTGPSNEWQLNYLPSIKEQPYINNYRDYIEQIRFQLAGYYTKDNSMHGTVKYETSMTTWRKLCQEYLEEVEFLRRKGFAQKKLAQILDGTESDWEKIEKIYDWVRMNTTWNEKFRLYPQQTPPKLLETGMGTNSEINLMLVLLIREAGLNCYPALTRTNNLGLLQKEYPLLSQFNQVLAYVELNGQKLFLNATSKFRPYDLLAVQDLNYQAFVLDPDQEKWEKIEPAKENRKIINMELDLRDTEEPVCKLVLSEKGYYAQDSRKSMSESAREEWMANLLLRSGIEAQIDTISIENEMDLSRSLGVRSTFSWEREEEDAQMFYLNPFLLNDLKKNPFLEENRQYRIDYNFLFSEGCTIRIIPPMGYEIVEYPKSQRIQLPQDMGKFDLYVQMEGNVLKLRTNFQIKVPVVPVTHYGVLKDFYAKVIDVLNSQVLLKKTI